MLKNGSESAQSASADAKELRAVPIYGNTLVVSVTFADAYGTPSTTVITDLYRSNEPSGR